MSLRRSLFALLLAGVLAAHFAALWGERGRGLDHDEAEYLHSAWLMNEGRQIYRDFFEDHTPPFFAGLAALQPAGGSPALPLLDVYRWAIRGRLAIAVLSTLTLAALGFLFRSELAAAMVAMALAAWPSAVWLRGFADLRADAVSLALFWWGAATVIAFPRRPYLAAGGLALVVASAAINPKWPLVSIVIGVLFLADLRRSRRIAPLVIPCLTAAAAVASIAMTASIRDVIDFTFLLKMRMVTSAVSDSWTAGRLAGSPFSELPLPAHPFAVALVSAVVVGLARQDTVNRRLSWSLLALAVASLVEIRFLYAWPRLWPQYYVMWSVAAAAMWGVLGVCALARLRRGGELVRAGSAIAAAVALVIALLPHISGTLASSPARWLAIAYVQQRLAPHDRVWIDATLHPIAARDASFYWYGFPDVLPLAIDATPPRHRIPFAALPPCRIEQGADRHTRFLEIGSWMSRYGEACRCTSRLLAAGMLVPTPISSIFEVRRPGVPPARPALFNMPRINVEDAGKFTDCR